MPLSSKQHLVKVTEFGFENAFSKLERTIEAFPEVEIVSLTHVETPLPMPAHVSPARANAPAHVFIAVLREV